MYWYYFTIHPRHPHLVEEIHHQCCKIIQFVIDLGFVYFATYTYFSARYFPWLPTAGHLRG